MHMCVAPKGGRLCFLWGFLHDFLPAVFGISRYPVSEQACFIRFCRAEASALPVGKKALASFRFMAMEGVAGNSDGFLPLRLLSCDSFFLPEAGFIMPSLFPLIVSFFLESNLG